MIDEWIPNFVSFGETGWIVDKIYSNIDEILNSIISVFETKTIISVFWSVIFIISHLSIRLKMVFKLAFLLVQHSDQW